MARTLAPLLGLCLVLQRLEALVPEALEEHPQLAEALGPRPIEPPRAVPALGHKPRLLQDVDVLGDRGPRDVELRGDVACRQLLVPDELQDASPPRLGD